MTEASPFSAFSVRGPDLEGGQAPTVYPQMAQIFADSDRRHVNKEIESAEICVIRGQIARVICAVTRWVHLIAARRTP